MLDLIHRSFFLPLAAQCLPSCRHGAYLGCQAPNTRRWVDIEKSLQRAVSGSYQEIVVPCHFWQNAWAHDLSQRCQALGFTLTAQIPLSALFPIFSSPVFSSLSPAITLEVVLDEPLTPETRQLLARQKWRPLIIMHKKTPWRKILESLTASERTALRFIFPYRLSWHDSNWRADQIHKIIRIIEKKWALHPRPPEGRDLWDPRIDEALDLEPLIKPQWEQLPKDHKPLISVVIPTYNNREYTVAVLRHLARQTLSPEQFEVIVVDDGSTDQTGARLRTLVAEELTTLPFRYLYSPRTKPRQMGDGHYRAGISRNVGVKHATGTYVCFLDSDILVPTFYLEKLLDIHQEWDVVQTIRHNLKRDVSSADTQYETISQDRDTFQTEDDYWEKFYATQNWMALPFFWKYACTYGFSLKRSLFCDIGWIRKVFVYYGFEDTDLAYRLARAGARFYLAPLTTYHLYHADTRSEFANSNSKRQELLAKTAQIFYRNNLDNDIYTHFRHLLKDGRRQYLWQKAKAWMSTL